MLLKVKPMTDERIRKGPSGPPIDVFSPSPSDANCIPVVNSAGDGFDMLAPGDAGSIIRSNGTIWQRENPQEMIGQVMAVSDVNSFIYGWFNGQIDSGEIDEPGWVWDVRPYIAQGQRLFLVMPLPDGRILFQSDTFASTGGVWEIPAGQPLITGVPIARKVFGRSTATRNVQGIGLLTNGSLLFTERISGADDQAISVGSALRGWPAAVAATAQAFTNASELLGGEFICGDNAGRTWVARFGGDSCARFDFSTPGAVVPDVTLSGSNFDQIDGVAVAEDGSLCTTRFNASVQVLNSGSLSSGNPAPDRTITPSTGDTGPCVVAFDKDGRLWVAYYNSGFICVFSAASYAAGGVQTPVLRIPLTTAQTVVLMNGFAVRR